MAFSYYYYLILLVFSFLLCSTWAVLDHQNNTSSSSAVDESDSIRSICKSTPYPDLCFDSLKLSVPIDINPNILSYLLSSLQVALSEAGKLTNIFSDATDVVEKQRGAIQDCKDLHQITTSFLHKSLSRINSLTGGSDDSTRKKQQLLADSRSFLAAALTNKNTCLEGLDSVLGPIRAYLVNSLITAYKHVTNSLSLLPRTSRSSSNHHRRRLLTTTTRTSSSGIAWLSRRRILQSDGSGGVLVVAADGTGNFSTIMDAIRFAPNNSDERIIIYVRQGLYNENVEIPSDKPNIVLLGDGSDVTVLTGNRSVGDGWTTFGSATLAVAGDGFLARDMTIQNTAGPEKHQAVALRVNADLAAIYRCTINGFQDTLYVHSSRQFYRECDIYGTVDFIFGNAAAVFQACNIISRLPMPGQYITITAQSRDNPEEDTGISFQNCSILATVDLYSNSTNFKSYLGRPWRSYSRVVYIESYIDDFIEPTGWSEWRGREEDEVKKDLDSLYYGEYQNTGPGSATDNRVIWSGYHVMDYDQASDFSVSQFITGDEWLDSTSFPYDDGV